MIAPLFQPHDRILFQGDSITDAGRHHTPGGLGNGYVAIVAGLLEAHCPELQLSILNRGISGNRTVELLERWKADCLDLKPQVLSIKIGVNDVWRKFQVNPSQTHVPLADYSKNLESLCVQALQSGVRKIVLISPTTITPENDSPANAMLGEYNAFVKELAQKIGAIHVEAREKILAARARNPEVAWTPDGCHPGISGHALIAQAWLNAVGLTSFLHSSIS